MYPLLLRFFKTACYVARNGSSIKKFVIGSDVDIVAHIFFVFFFFLRVPTTPFLLKRYTFSSRPNVCGQRTEYKRGFSSETSERGIDFLRKEDLLRKISIFENTIFEHPTGDRARASERIFSRLLIEY